MSTPPLIVRGEPDELRSTLRAGHPVFIGSGRRFIGLEPYPHATQAAIMTMATVRGGWAPIGPLFATGDSQLVRVTDTADDITPVFSASQYGYTTLEDISRDADGTLRIRERAYNQDITMTPQAFGAGYASAVARARAIAYGNAAGTMQLPLHLRIPGYAYSTTASKTYVRDADGGLYRIRPAGPDGSLVYDVDASEVASTDVEYPATVTAGPGNRFLFGDGYQTKTAPITEMVDIRGRHSDHPLAAEFAGRVGRLTVRDLRDVPGH